MDKLDFDVKDDAKSSVEVMERITPDLTNVPRDKIPKFVRDYLKLSPYQTTDRGELSCVVYNYFSPLQVAQTLLPLCVKFNIEIPFDVVGVICDYMQLCAWDTKVSSISKSSNIQVFHTGNDDLESEMIDNQATITSLNSLELENEHNEKKEKQVSKTLETTQENNASTDDVTIKTTKNTNDTNDTKENKENKDNNNNETEISRNSRPSLSRQSSLAALHGTEYPVSYAILARPNGDYYDTIFLNEWMGMLGSNAVKLNSEKKDNNNNNNSDEKKDVDAENKESDKEYQNEENINILNSDDTNSKTVYRYVFRYYGGDLDNGNEKLFQIGIVTQDFSFNQTIGKNGKANDNGIGDCKNSFCWYADGKATKFKHHYRQFYRQKTRLNFTKNSDSRYIIMEINLLTNIVKISGPAIENAKFCRQRLLKLPLPKGLKAPFKLGITMSAAKQTADIGFGLVNIN